MSGSESDDSDDDYTKDVSEEDGSQPFMLEDLVWPDPDGVFKGQRGFTPLDLAFPKPPVIREETRCDKAKKRTKMPRPTELPWNVVIIQSDPPSVDIDYVEEFLVHDPLFVEFFNAFLALPSFPEPLCFNIDTGGFEVVSDEKQKLARQIKEAVRSQQLTASMYRVARKHAFSDMPIIPIEDNEGSPQEVKIDTTYQVTTLNKDQGIYWIRAERLPIFLESDFYFTYRLAKVISQARLFNDNNEYVIMKLDYTPRPKKSKKRVEVPPPNPVDILKKRMFLDFGDARDDARQAYVEQAMEQLKPNAAFTLLQRKGPAARHDGEEDSDLKIDTRPKSSVFRSQYFGIYSPGLAGPGESEPPIKDEMVPSERMFTPTCPKPNTPRPSEKIHMATDKLRTPLSRKRGAEEEMVTPGTLVKMYPKQDNQSADDESGIGDMDDKDDESSKRLIEAPIIDELYNDGTWEMQGNLIVLRSKAALAAVIVGAVMKKTLSNMLEVEEDVIVKDPLIKSLYPTDSLTCLSVDRLDLCVVEKKKKKKKKEDEKKTVKKSDSFSESSRASSIKGPPIVNAFKQTAHIKWDKPVYKPAEEESDADSLLDSDEDFEERDLYFRRNQNKWHSLQSIKGIMDFKKFLEGTSGEKYWELWIDIDKGRLITDDEENNQFIQHLRNRYYKHGSYYELSTEDKKKLGLVNISAWNPSHLFQIQARLLEPLVLYWAPRYLLKHLVQSHPEQYPMYRQLMSASTPKEADPHPHTRALLPLGPKSCCPRRSAGSGFDKSKPIYKYNEAEFTTTPKVGNRRVYGSDTLKRLALTPTAKFLGLQRKTLDNENEDQEICLDDPNCNNPKERPDSSGLKLKRKNKSRQDESSDQKNADHKHSLLDMESPSKTFVGKLSGMTSRRPSNTLGPTDKEDQQPLSRPTSSVTTRTHYKKCPNRPLTAVLGEGAAGRVSKPQLGPVKKPKDLLSPMLKIIDTKNGNKQGVVTASSDRVMSKTTFYRQDSHESKKSCPSVPGDAVGPDTIEFTEIQDCDFMGSERMEFLLQALHHEQASGKTFRKFIEKSERSDWINNLDFWEQVQEYRKLFYMDKLDLFLIAKLAKSIFAKCIVDGSVQNIGVSDSVELSVMMKLNPAYEDLFDEAEEHSLKVLFEAFQLYLSQDVKTYCKVERADVMRRLETRNTYILNLQKQGIIKEGPLTPDDPMEGYVEPVCDESLLEKIPEEYRDWNLDKLLHNRLELENFRQYLAENYAEMDLKCWMDMEAWRRTPPDDERKREQRVRDIKKNYLNRKYFFGPSSPAGKDGQNKVMEAGGGWGKFLEDKPHADSIVLAQKYVQERLEKKHLPLFLLSKDFKARQSPHLSMADSAEDVLVQKKRRSQAVLKVKMKENQEFFFGTIQRLKLPTLNESKSMIATSIIPSFSSHTLVPQPQKSTSNVSKQTSSVHLPPVDVEKSETVHLPTVDIEKSETVHLPPEDIEKSKSETVHLPPVDKEKVKLEKEKTKLEKLAKLEALLESKWVSSTKEIFLFKHALQNPITCKLFRKYVSLKGDNLENDVLFWQEVQKYKKMNHSHTDDANLTQKINAIVHCFLDSTIPPALQIDIPQEMADRILDHKHEKSPYLFREAQLATFRILLQHWQPFCEWRNNMNTDERAMITLERHKILSKQKEAVRRAEIEEQKERERLLRFELGLGSSDDLPDDLFDDESADKTEDKMAFSYAEYIASMKKEEDDKAALDTSSFYNLNLASFEDNASQTVRGIPQYEGQPYYQRPGFSKAEAKGLNPRMMMYTKQDINNYYKYILDEVAKREEAERKKKLETSSESSD